MQRKAYRWEQRRIFHPCIEEYRVFWGTYKKAFMEAKESHWSTFLEEIDMYTVFKAGRIVMRPHADAGRARIPVLQRDGEDRPRVVENEEKSSIFFDKFFIPPADPNHGSIPRRPKYPNPAFQMEHISDRQVNATIRQLAPYM